MHGQYGMRSLKFIISQVAIPAVAELQFDFRCGFVLNLLFFCILNAEKGQVSSENPIHLLMLESLLLRSTVVLDMMVEVLIVWSNELPVLSLLT